MISRWSKVGVGGGGAMFMPTVSPHDPDTVLVSCDMTGCYLTHDGGQSWRNFNLRGKAAGFAFDPHDPDSLYVATGSAGLWRSQDRGASWEIIYPDPASIAQLSFPDDHAETSYLLTDGGRGGSVTAIAADPCESGRLYLAEQALDDTVLATSGDRGRTWTTLARLPGETVRDICVAPLDYSGHDPTLYLVTDLTLYEYRAGRTQAVAQPGRGSPRVAHAFGITARSTVFYWACSDSLLVSTNRGRSWEESRLPGSGYGMHAIAASASDPRICYLSYHGLEVGAHEYFGIARTSDGGGTWTPVRADSPERQDRTDDCWVNQTPARSEWAWGVGVAPHDPNACYITDWGSVWKTTDAGLRWQQVYFRRVTPSTVTTTGLDVTTNYGIFWDPFDRTRQFIAYTDIGLIRSEDNGQSWRPTQAGIPELWHNTTYWMVFDPDERGKVWAVMAYDHDLPRPKMWRHRSTGTYSGGVCVSRDGGRTWRVATDGLPATAPTHILLDPQSPVGARTLYVAAMGRGVFKSTDGGGTWHDASDGILEQEPLAWRMSLAADGTLYLVVFRRSEHDRGPGHDGALYRSSDGAHRWHPLPLPDQVNGPAGILSDPDDPDRLYLAAWRSDTADGDGSGGIFLSPDRGRTWRRVLDRDQHVYDITCHPEHPGWLFAAGFESNAWRSTDRGASWDRIKGFNFKWAHRVIPDIHDPASIYVATYGGGLWHGPAGGDADAPEDIRTPNLRYTAPSTRAPML